MPSSLEVVTSLHTIRHDGLTPYVDAWDEQRKLHAARVAGEISDTVVLLEHEPVYTAGKRTEPFERPLADACAPVIDVDRGGKITWHGPGQITGYPIVELRDPIDVVAYVRRVEQLMINVCAEFGLGVERIDKTGYSGVWIQADTRGPDRKVGAVGIRVAQSVTMHGFALNCDNDLSWFDRIVPCGISDAGVSSLSRELGHTVSAAEVFPVVEKHLADVLDIQPVVSAAAAN